MKIKPFQAECLKMMVLKANASRIPADAAAAIAYAAKITGISYDAASRILSKKPFGLIPADRSAIGARMIVEVDNSHIASRPLGPTIVSVKDAEVAFS
jgi:hypothetical protein